MALKSTRHSSKCCANQYQMRRALTVSEVRPHLRDLLHQDIEGQAIRVADHCYGCTAGQGSSCGGALP
jgi:hypothetical protein